MPTTITLTGLYTPALPETRNIANIDVVHNDVTYQWQIYIPQEVDIATYLADSTARVAAEIDAKEYIWLTAEKTKTIDTGFGDAITFSVNKQDIVAPDIPDYYAKRRDAYPPIGEQMGAIFKGVDSVDFQTMQSAIQAVKDMYPKPNI